jgi:hypothetical protein
MRRVLYVLGAVFLGILVVGGFAIGLAAYNGMALDTESKAYVDAAIPAITQNWSEAELLDRATPELRNNTAPAQLASLFNSFGQLGHLVRYGGSTGSSMMSYASGVGQTISASYVAKATFQNGAVSFHVGLLKRNDRWLISSFRLKLDSAVPAYLRPTTT